MRPANGGELESLLPAPAREVRYVALDRDWIAGKSSPFWRPAGEGRMLLPLPDGSNIAVAIEGSEMLGPDRFTSRGRIAGRPGSRALFSWSGGFLNASVEDPELGTFVLRSVAGDLAQWYRVDPALVAPCGGERLPSLAEKQRAAAGGTHGVPPPPASHASSASATAEIHVLMAYTPAVRADLAGAARFAALQSVFDLAMARVNEAFYASLVSARVKLVGLVETAYDESVSAANKVQDEALTALYREDDGKMDDIHAARDAAGADVVMLALNRHDSASSGLSFLLDDPGESTNALFAFSVVQFSAVSGTNVVAHELGHVLGCAHDREHALSGRGAYAYSYGYRFLGADGRWYHDIMAYPGTPRATELAYFSNPKIVLPDPIRAAIGVAAGSPGESDNAQTIERTALATSLYRLPGAAPTAGSLINVSTRAFVGAGDQVLIGGFVVGGTQPANVLVRAAGPALLPFGVAGALADPVLRIFDRGTAIASNDNWTPDATGPGAFPFAPGSADAAVLVRVPAGAYTAVVEGVGGATGYGIVEAYQLDQDGYGIVNLSTRGYADRGGKELFGGFVIGGAPGTRKRVLVRVLGPTLSREPFNMTGTLDDPEMEVRNTAGDIVVKNDDWSLGAEGGASAENDFRPLVETYGERQIFATGHAPKNRREPAALMDLPPGGYTVIVRPFELRDDNPSLDQPARPGVGIVEVYEVGR